MADDVMQTAHDELNPDWQELAKIAYQKKYRGVPIADFKDKQKRQGYLAGKGFGFDIAYELV